MSFVLIFLDFSFPSTEYFIMPCISLDTSTCLPNMGMSIQILISLNSYPEGGVVALLISSRSLITPAPRIV